jgi:hypothetical protein
MEGKQSKLPNTHDPLLYEEVCKSLHQIDDFRARLLGLLPLSSGVGIFLLLGTSDGGASSIGRWLGVIGVIGFVISFGLFVYEVRQSVICGYLIRVGSKLEQSMGFQEGEGQFWGRPAPSGLKESGHLLEYLQNRDNLKHPSMPMASTIVYVMVLIGWIVVAGAGFTR